VGGGLAVCGVLQYWCDCRGAASRFLPGLGFGSVLAIAVGWEAPDCSPSQGPSGHGVRAAQNRPPDSRRAPFRCCRAV